MRNDTADMQTTHMKIFDSLTKSTYLYDGTSDPSDAY